MPEAGETGQLRKDLSCKHENLMFRIHKPIKIAEHHYCSCHPRYGMLRQKGTEAGSGRPYLKIRWRAKEEGIQVGLWSSPAHAPSCVYTYTLYLHVHTHTQYHISQTYTSHTHTHCILYTCHTYTTHTVHYIHITHYTHRHTHTRA